MKNMLKKGTVGTSSSKGNGLLGLPASGASSKGNTRPSSGTKKPISGSRPGISQSSSAQGHYDSSS